MLLNSSLYVAHTRGKFTQTGSSCKIQLPIPYFGVKFPLFAFPQEEFFYTVSLYKAGEGQAGPVPVTAINSIIIIIFFFIQILIQDKSQVYGYAK